MILGKITLIKFSIYAGGHVAFISPVGITQFVRCIELVAAERFETWGGGVIVKPGAFLYSYFLKCLALFVCTNKLLCDVSSVQLFR